MVADVGNNENAEENDEDELRVGWASFKVVSQILNTYILVESSTGVTLIEQHVADERALYEKYLRSWRGNFKILKEPLELQNSIPEESLFNLVSLGFEIDEFNVVSVPSIWFRLDREELEKLLLVISSESHTVESACVVFLGTIRRKVGCDAEEGHPCVRNVRRELIVSLDGAETAFVYPEQLNVIKLLLPYRDVTCSVCHVHHVDNAGLEAFV